jgi:hypothetical protein
MWWHLTYARKGKGAVETWALWPKLLSEYKSYTRERNGRIGILYYLFILNAVAAFLLLVSIFVCSFLYDVG